MILGSIEQVLSILYELSNPSFCGMDNLSTRVEYLEQVSQSSEAQSLIEQVDDLRRAVDAHFYQLGDKELLNALLASWEPEAPPGLDEVETQIVKANYERMLLFVERIETASGFEIPFIKPIREPIPRELLFQEFDSLTLRNVTLCAQWIRQLAMENGSLALVEQRLAKHRRLQNLSNTD